MSGVLFQAMEAPAEGAMGTMRLAIQGFNERIVAKARITRTYETAAAAILLERPVALLRCVEWLAQTEGIKPAATGT